MSGGIGYAGGVRKMSQVGFRLWLALLVLAAVGGWIVGRSVQELAEIRSGERLATGGERSGAPVVRGGFSEGSPQGRWMAAVKAAESEDFARLNEEWENVFPYDDRYEEGYSPDALHALRWLMGVWLVKDPDGFMQAAAGESFRNSYYAAQAMAELMPGKALALIMGPGREKFDDFFIGNVVSTLAEKHPALYLKMNPDGTTELTPGSGYNDDWLTAITHLADTDAKAAGDACLRWKVENSPRTLHDALLAVAKAWKPGDPPIQQWINTIQDPMMKGAAHEMSLAALAEEDPHLALDRLLQCKALTGSEATVLILTQLAKVDPLEALLRVKDVEKEISTDADSDPFAEQVGDAFVNPDVDPFVEQNVDPFAEHPIEDPVVEEPPSPSLDPLEDIRSAARYVVMGVIREDLPDDPVGMLGEFRSLIERAGIHDPVWQQDMESDLIQSVYYGWSASQCLDMAEMWALSEGAENHTQTFERLAAQAASKNAHEALEGMERFPASVRPKLLGDIIQHLPVTDTTLRMSLLEQLPLEQWDNSLAGSLGAAGSEFAPIIARQPVQASLDVRRSFAGGWGEMDPDAAAAWVRSLPDDEGAKSAASGLVRVWVHYDRDAATAWAMRLPPSAAREGATEWIAELTPHDESLETE